MRSHNDALHKSSRHGIQRPSPAPCGRVRYDHLFGRAILEGPNARRPRSVPFPLFSLITVRGHLHQFAEILGQPPASGPGRRLTIAATCPRRSGPLLPHSVGSVLGGPRRSEGATPQNIPRRVLRRRKAPLTRSSEAPYPIPLPGRARGEGAGDRKCPLENPQRRCTSSHSSPRPSPGARGPETEMPVRNRKNRRIRSLSGYLTLVPQKP
jgi:hypothetical protein